MPGGGAGDRGSGQAVWAGLKAGWVHFNLLRVKDAFGLHQAGTSGYYPSGPSKPDMVHLIPYDIFREIVLEDLQPLLGPGFYPATDHFMNDKMFGAYLYFPGTSMAGFSLLP